VKRDMDLIRNILIMLEDAPFDGGPLRIARKMSDHPPNQVSYHVMLLRDAGLIYALDFSPDESTDWRPVCLTWAGHEFLEAAKDDTRWNRAKNHVKEKGGPMVFDILRSLLVSYAKQAVLGPADT
jgi:hypothetical protein